MSGGDVACELCHGLGRLEVARDGGYEVDCPACQDGRREAGRQRSIAVQQRYTFWHENGVWVVDGPGVDRQVLPCGATAEQAKQLAAMLAGAYEAGLDHARQQIRHAIGLDG